MTDNKNSDVLLKAFGDHIGIPGLCLDDEGVCALSLDDEYVLNIKFDEKNNNLILFSSLCEVAEKNQNEVYQHMLKANFAWQGTNGATLCLQGTKNRVGLIRKVSLFQTESQSFIQIIEDFVNTADEWISIIEHIEKNDKVQDEEIKGEDIDKFA